MANATEAIEKHFRKEELSMTTKLTVATGVTIYQGTLVSIDGSGNAVVATTSARIAGIAEETAAAGETVTVLSGLIVRLALTGAAATHVNTTVYAADNQTAQAASNTAILGRVVDYETGYVWVLLTLRA